MTIRERITEGMTREEAYVAGVADGEELTLEAVYTAFHDYSRPFDEWLEERMQELRHAR